MRPVLKMLLGPAEELMAKTRTPGITVLADGFVDEVVMVLG